MNNNSKIEKIHYEVKLLTSNCINNQVFPVTYQLPNITYSKTKAIQINIRTLNIGYLIYQKSGFKGYLSFVLIVALNISFIITFIWSSRCAMILVLLQLAF